jgi:GT2 family glycosyltransferase
VEAGYRVQYVPNVVAAHSGAHSVGQLPAGCRALYWCVSLLRYAAKHFGPLGYRGVSAALVLSAVPRLLAGMIRERSLKSIAVYCKVACIAGLCLVSVGRRGEVGQENT